MFRVVFYVFENQSFPINLSLNIFTRISCARNSLFSLAKNIYISFGEFILSFAFNSKVYQVPANKNFDAKTFDLFATNPAIELG